MKDKYMRATKDKKHIFTNNFIGGIAWGLGVTVGLTVFLALLAFVANRIDFVPIVGDFIAEVLNYIVEQSGQLPGRDI